MKGWLRHQCLDIVLSLWNLKFQGKSGVLLRKGRLIFNLLSCAVYTKVLSMTNYQNKNILRVIWF